MRERPPSRTRALAGRAVPKHQILVVQIRATLRDVHPPVWRRVELLAGSTLADLHEVLQTVFGWLGHHVHEFRFGEALYGTPDEEAPVHQKDEERALLGDVVEEGMTGLYAYDFGDGWEHDLLVEAVRPFDSDLAYPLCTGGARACPPDDCGGPHRYAEMLEILADRDHPEHSEQRRWVGGFFDPEGFDANRTNRDLRELRETARRTR